MCVQQLQRPDEFPQVRDEVRMIILLVSSNKSLKTKCLFSFSDHVLFLIESLIIIRNM